MNACNFCEIEQTKAQIAAMDLVFSKVVYMIALTMAYGLISQFISLTRDYLLGVSNDQEEEDDDEEEDEEDEEEDDEKDKEEDDSTDDDYNEEDDSTDEEGDDPSEDEEKQEAACTLEQEQQDENNDQVAHGAGVESEEDFTETSQTNEGSNDSSSSDSPLPQKGDQ